MLSAVIHSQHSYPAVLLAEQLVHQRLVHSGPLVLGADLLKFRRLQQIGDQPVLRNCSYKNYCNAAITNGIGLYIHPFL